jgi:predicted TIM-barrel fold metal-dependent hydrolase
MLTRRAMLHRTGVAGVAAFALRNRAAHSEPRSAVDFDVPRGACDCHVHVFGDPKKFPFAPSRAYTPPEASIEELLALQNALRLDRVVVIQPSVYGVDNSCTVDAVRRLGSRARGIAVIDRATSRTALEEMAGIGIRGIRLNLQTGSGGRVDPALARGALETAVEQIRDLHWHIQIFTRLAVIDALKEPLEQLPFPVVFDHFGSATATLGPNQPGIDALIDLLASGRAYAKISAAYRISLRAPDYADATPVAQRLVAANPDRIVWGSDWPHPNGDNARGKPFGAIAEPFPIDDGLVFDQLPKWVPDPALRRKILVDNPARLYGFDPIAP